MHLVKGVPTGGSLNEDKFEVYNEEFEQTRGGQLETT